MSGGGGRRAVFGSVVAAACAVACGGVTESAPAPDRQAPLALYVGALDGSDAKVAVVHDDARWAAYVCGGPSTLSSMTAWFEGNLGASGSRGAATTEGREFRTTLDADTAIGTLTLDDVAMPFLATRVPEDAPSGLFQVVSGGCRTGLIMPPEGEPQGVYCASEGSPRVSVFAQVTPVTGINAGSNVVSARVVGARVQVLDLARVLLPLPGIDQPRIQ